jgi:hypothetical protein
VSEHFCVCEIESHPRPCPLALAQAELASARQRIATMQEALEAVDWIAGSNGDERTLREALASVRRRVAPHMSAPKDQGPPTAPWCRCQDSKYWGPCPAHPDATPEPKR